MGERRPPERASEPFVGRDDELDALRAHLAAAEGGRGRIVLVSGDAGIGKTRLVEEALTPLPPERAPWGRCRDAAGTPAFGPWREALAAYVGVQPDAALRATLGADANEVARLVPALQARLGVTPSPASADDDAARFQLFDALSEFLLRAAAEQPLAIVLDDLHWADSESLLLLRHLGAGIGGGRLMVVGTYRELEMRQAAAVPRILADLSRVSQRVPLRGLGEAAVADFARSRAAELPPDAIAELHRATEGNPFFVKHLIALLEREGWDAGRPLPLPAAVRDAVRCRIEPIPPAGRRLLGIAAVLGRDFDLVTLSRLAEQRDAEVLAELAEPIAAGLVHEAAGPIVRLRFSHALVQDTLYDDLGEAERARLHGAAGALLEARAGSQGDATPSEIASHYFRAHETGALHKAVALSVRAGDEALAALGYEEAAGHYERALDAQRTLDGAPAERLGLLLAFGDAQARAGDADGLRATFLEAASIARRFGDGVGLARAALGFGTLPALLEDDATLVALLEEALEALPAGDSPLRARVLARLVLATYHSATLETRWAWADEAVALARRLGDGRILSSALRSQYYTRTATPDVEGRLAILREAIAAAERAGDFAVACEARANAVSDTLELGEVAEADTILAVVEEAAERFRLTRWRWRVAVLRAIRALIDGNLADAEARSERAAAMAGRGVRPSDAIGFHAAILFSVRRAQGRLGELLPALARQAEQSNEPVWRAVLALAYAETDDIGAASALLAELAERDFTDIPAGGIRVLTLAFLADVCAAIGNAQIAEPLFAVLSREASPFIMSPAGCFGSRARPLGLLALVRGRVDEAIALLEEAVATNERLGARIEVARSQLGLLRAQQARGGAEDLARAAVLAAAARAAAEELDLQRILAELARCEPARSAAGTAAAPPAAPRAAFLRRDDGEWTIGRNAETTALRDVKGLHYLRRLLATPGQDIAALELAGSDADARPAKTAGAAPRQPIASGATRDHDEARAHLRALRDELEEATEFNDLGRVASLREEIEAAAEQLATQLGAGERGADASRDRAAERARVNVTRAIQAVLQRIAQDCPDLGHHLQSSIRTGTLCAYRPAPGTEIDWEL